MPMIPLFDMRRYSRNSNATSKERKEQQAQAPPVPSSPITRQPLVPQALNSSQTSLSSNTSSGGSPSKGATQRRGKARELDDGISKATSSRSRPSTAGSSREGTVSNMSLGPPASPQRSTYVNHPDLYTHNALHSFSFGAASNSATPLSRSIDPLSPVRDDDSDEGLYRADTTPRPSLVSSSSPRSLSSQLPPMQPQHMPTSLPPPPRRAPAKAERVRTTSSSSRHTSGTSSASASASSLSSAAAMEFSAESQRGDSSVTSEDDDEEHRHPIPATPSFLNHPTDKLSLYGSDDDDLDEDFADDYEPDIEISSFHPQDPDPTPDHRIFDNPSQESFQPSFAPRRGSLAVPIPSPNTVEGRDREDSIATLRRPSRSLEGLRSDSRAEGDAARLSDSRPDGPSPTSVPESATDWREVRRLSAQREPIAAAAAGPSSTTPSVTSSSTAVQSVLEGFDSSWNIDPITGIVNLEWDQSEMQDIVGGFEGPPSSNRSYRRGSSSTESGRRLSTTSTNSDPFFKGLSKWGGQVYQDEKDQWTFKREKADRLEEHKSYDRERSGIGGLITRKGSYTTASSSSIGAFQDFGSYSKDGKLAVKDPARKEPQSSWKGMAVGAEEWWWSHINGRYRVTRQNQQNHDPMKPPQQRLNIQNHRTPYSAKSSADGPTCTIHKHSKANGFSISRHYRIRKKTSVAPNGRPSTSSRATAAIGGETEQKQKSSNMVLLAPRRVQEQYTSTNTTRKLESHGLLTDGRHDLRDLERLSKIEREKKERIKKEKEKEKQRQKELRKAEMARSKDKGKSKSANSASATDSGGSVGSVVNDVQPHLTPSPPAGPSHHASRSSVDQSVFSQDTVSSDRTVVSAVPQRIVDDAANYDFDDYDDDDDFDDPTRRRRPPSRTPHAEVFSPLPPETLESFVHQDSHSRRTFLSWGQSKNNSNLPRPLENVYKPQWPVASASRHQNEKKGMTLETLNTSFQDVGLLPAVDEVKNSNRSSKRKQQKQAKGKEDKENVFHSFSSDYLYMLLPLWPGETDVLSTTTHPYPPPNIPLELRKYLLLYYCPDDNGTDRNKNSSSDSGKKHRSRPSPTSSRDSTTKSSDKHILLDKFHFCARIVSYADIQGSGVRSPDVGLSVLGPLQEAVETMPTDSFVDTFQVIGMCSSRERGIEFVPEGLEKLGLARRVPDPQLAPDEHDPPAKRYSITGVEESDEVSDTMLILTPIGRAVVEMAWLGAMALTSFAPPN